MEQLIEFASAHYLLIAAWLFTLIIFLWIEGQKSGKAVSPAIATQMVNKEGALLLDIRTRKEWETGHIAGAKHIPLADLDHHITELYKFKEKPVIVVCNFGQSAGSAAKRLKADGFQNVIRLGGGMTEWKGQNLPVIK